MSIDLQPIHFKLKQPFRFAGGAIANREGVVLRAELNGHVGLGEASPLPGISPDTLVQAVSYLQGVRDELQGLFLADMKVIDCLRVMQGWPGHSPAGLYAAESSFLAHRAASEDKAIAELLTPQAMTELPVNGLVDLGGEESVIVGDKESCGVYKIKVDEDISALCARMESLLSTVDASVTFRLDANGRWRPENIREIVDQISHFPIDYVEQPFAVDTPLQEWCAFKAYAPFAIAADESLRSLADIDRFIEAGACDIFVLKPTCFGGYYRTALAHQRIRSAELDTVITHAFEGAVARRHHFELGCTLLGMERPSGLSNDYAVGETYIDGLGLQQGNVIRQTNRIL